MLDVPTLVERCRRGDDLAWEALVRRYQSRVYAISRHYMRDAEEARDTAQEIFVRVYRRLATFHGGEAFLPWLVSVARNCCVDRLRKRKVRSPTRSIPIDDAPQIAADEPDPAEAAEAGARRRLLYRALDRLSATNREMILLHEIQGMKLDEIARMLGLPIGTVKSRSNRARIELARKLRGIAPSYGV